MFYSGSADTHEHGVRFIVNNTITNSVIGCQAVSSRIIAIRLKKTPFNITIIQGYTPTSDYSDLILVLASSHPAMGTSSILYLLWARRPCGAAGWLGLLLIKAGNVETNMGPTITHEQSGFVISAITKYTVRSKYR